MLIRWSAAFAILASLDAIMSTDNSEASMTSVEIIRSRGYSCTIHHVTTGDGYILELHRIGSNKKRPILLQHGLLGTSADWIINPTEDSLAFLLSDLGYDVWLANARGNTYSRSHVRLDPRRPAFWDFSYDEMGMYDVPTNINYILAATSEAKLIYIGHSMGTTIFYIAMVTHPDLNAKIDMMISLAPVASLAHLSSPVKVLATYSNSIQKYLRWTRTTAFLDSNSRTRKLQKAICQRSLKTTQFCRNALFFISGADPQNFNSSLLPVIESHYPAGTSVNTLTQFAQNFKSGKTSGMGNQQKFVAFDRGAFQNLRHYGKLAPPAYNLSLVKVPVYLFWGENDLFATPQDVNWLSGQLGNLKASIKVDWPKFSHLDFIWGINNDKLLYGPLLSLLPLP